MSKLIQIDMAMREHFVSKTTYSPSECYSCGTCTATCPHNELKPEGQKLTVRKILHQAQLGVEPDSLVWECSSCKLCEVRCPREVDIVDNFISIRNFMIENRKTQVPGVYTNLLWNILEESNPMGEAKADRGAWLKSIDGIKDANTEQVDILFFVGGPESYDARLQAVARDMAKIMQKAGVNFGVLGKTEPESGEVIRETGEQAYMEILIKKNIEQFEKTGASAIIPLSPHAYDIFKRLYKNDFGMKMEVIHYTEFLDLLITDGKLGELKEVNMKVTYHDPCYLGRWNDIYEQPRNVLRAIPGIELLEMPNNRVDAICCGGGGNKIYTDIKSEERLSNVRVAEARDTGAVEMVTSCGYCIQNFEDSSKSIGANMEILDLAEVVAKAIGVRN
ncbi:MAG: (Fe-S)-binding protein [Candidatus Heimdallarchaeota archaeon]|nr:(Fe-S)-binding protein [Candidatus Heimdallarchaeota archaeon]